MPLSNKVFESTTTVRFPDCDPFNHLNNARYIDYFMNAREDHLWTSMKFSPYIHAKQTGLSWVVGSNQIAYLKPAQLMETIVIRSTLLKMRERDILVEMTLWNKESTVLKSLLWARFVHFSLTTQRSEVHSEALITQFQPLENPIDETITFEKRVEMVRGFSAAELYPV